MSKSVRLEDYLYGEIERLAKLEKRSLANMVKVLLEQALKIDSTSAARSAKGSGVQGDAGNTLTTATPEPVETVEQKLTKEIRVATGRDDLTVSYDSTPITVKPDDHFKPYPKPVSTKKKGR